MFALIGIIIYADDPHTIWDEVLTLGEQNIAVTLDDPYIIIRHRLGESFYFCITGAVLSFVAAAMTSLYPSIVRWRKWDEDD